MARRTNARSAGCTYVLYIALGVTALVLLNGATGAQEIESKIAGIARHATEVVSRPF
ncbi:MAG: hypothetical protein M3348_08255 [Acidobacteriota bacterium]|nr:hypothetical protein [Acidobacteriota bacterium]